MPNNIATLFAAQTTNASSAAFNAIGTGTGSSRVQETFLTVYGTFGGASVQLEYKAADDQWYSTNDDPFISPGAYFALINTRLPYRLTISGAGESTTIGATVYDVSTAA